MVPLPTVATNRKWTDQQLISAVVSAKDWNDVVTAVGRRRSERARRTVQGHSLRLGLDVQHLPPFSGVTIPQSGRRSVTKEQMSDAVGKSTTWSEVIRTLGWPASGATQKRVRTLATEYGLDVSHLVGLSWRGEPVSAQDLPFSKPVDQRNLPQVSLLAAADWFMRRGYMVSVPLEPSAYDLIAESDCGLKRVQVKTCANAASMVRIQRCQYGRSSSPSNGKYSGRRPYRKDEIDLFFILTLSGGQYLIPAEAVDGQQSLTLEGKYENYKI
jgi:PD-(D/E)XK endonuclease